MRFCNVCVRVCVYVDLSAYVLVLIGFVLLLLCVSVLIWCALVWCGCVGVSCRALFRVGGACVLLCLRLCCCVMVRVCYCGLMLCDCVGVLRFIVLWRAMLCWSFC